MKKFKRGDDKLYYYRDFGKAVMAVRNLIGVTQKEAARLAGISEKYLRGIEKGRLNLEDQKLNRLLASLGTRWATERFLAMIDDDNLSQKQRIVKFLGLYSKLK